MTDVPRGPTTEELRARALWLERLSDEDALARNADTLAALGAVLLPRPCLACNREQGERMCDLCQRLEVAEASAR